MKGGKLMKKIMRMRENKGFTLAELLIVVAIIAVLVAIAIPVFSSQLEKAKQATDAANIRAAYAEAVVKSLETGSNASVDTINPMKSSSWNKTESTYIGDKSIDTINKTIGSKIQVTVDTSGSASFSAH